MQFYMPARVYQEADCVRAHAKELAALGTKALLVTGRHSAKACGAYDDVTAALEENGVSYALFDQVEENPCVETIVAGRDAGLAAECDFVIGIGGGSPMDAAKAIALLMAHPKEDWTFMYDLSRGGGALPVAAVPTTCGTGSEVTGVSVLIRKEKRTKGSIAHRIFPELSLVDGKYLTYAPVSMIANTAVDALAHLMESDIHSKATEYSRMCALGGLALWRRSRTPLLLAVEMDSQGIAWEQIMEEVLTDAVRNDLMCASTLAGMAIAQSGTTIPHGLSYTLTVEMGMPHGMACGYFLSRYIAEASEADQQRIFEASGFADAADLQQYYEAVCRPPEVPRKLRQAAADATLNSPAKLAACPYPVDRAVMERIAGLA